MVAEAWSTDPSVLTVRAPAKINLHLGVGRVRADGFHPLDTVYHAVGLYDDITVADADHWRLDCALADYIPDHAVPLGEANIVWRAAEALATRLGRDVCADVHIAKTIPAAGGLAGGSADAAAAILGLARLWTADLPDEQLLAIAAELGSDVPFALVGGTAHGGGRGEIVTPIDDLGSWWWVLVPAAEGLSTPKVYAEWDRLFPDAPADPPGSQALVAALASGRAQQVAAALHNDLQEAACSLRPDLARLIDAGESAGALRGLVSGSGPTVAFLCGSAVEAREVAAALRSGTMSHDGREVVLVAGGPVAGAHLVEYTP